MPRFNLTTIERWEQRVSYSNIEADSVDDAYAQVCAGDIPFCDHELIECGDEVLYLSSATDERNESLDVPADLSRQPDEPADSLDLLRRLVHCGQATGGWEAPIWREAEAMVMAAGTHGEPHATDRPRVIAFVEGGVVQAARTSVPMDFQVLDLDNWSAADHEDAEQVAAYAQAEAEYYNLQEEVL